MAKKKVKTKTERRKEKETAIDTLVLERMRQFDKPFSCDELAGRLEVLDRLKPATVAASMRRLRKERLIFCPDPETEDGLCETHKVLGRYRWIAVN